MKENDRVCCIYTFPILFLYVFVLILNNNYSYAQIQNSTSSSSSGVVNNLSSSEVVECTNTNDCKRGQVCIERDPIDPIKGLVCCSHGFCGKNCCLPGRLCLHGDNFEEGIAYYECVGTQNNTGSYSECTKCSPVSCRIDQLYNPGDCLNCPQCLDEQGTKVFCFKDDSECLLGICPGNITYEKFTCASVQRCIEKNFFEDPCKILSSSGSLPNKANCKCQNGFIWENGQCIKSKESINCTQEIVPVCGCDNKTYNNSCLAKLAGVNWYIKGSCETMCASIGDCPGSNGICPNGQQYLIYDCIDWNCTRLSGQYEYLCSALPKDSNFAGVWKAVESDSKRIITFNLCVKNGKLTGTVDRGKKFGRSIIKEVTYVSPDNVQINIKLTKGKFEIIELQLTGENEFICKFQNGSELKGEKIQNSFKQCR